MSAKSHTYATSLLADLRAADGFLPRRDELKLWLEAFLDRAQARNFHAAPQEISDLGAIDLFLRANHQAVTVRPAL